MSKFLYEIAHIYNGADYKKNPPGGTVPIYGTGGLMGYTSIPLYNGPAVLSGRKGSINNPIFVEGGFWNVDTIFCIKADAGIDAKWLFYNFLNTDLSILNEATGVPSVNSKALYKLKFKWFELPIQVHISHILTNADTVIEKTQASIAKYKAIKQGMLHDLFTRGIDITTGKLRPKSEDAPELYKESKLGMVPGEWEVQQLDQICSMKSGEGITSKSIQEMGDYPVYGGNGLRGYAKNYTHEGEYTLIGRQGALCGNITRVSGKLFASEHAVVVTAGNEIDIDWVSQKLDTMNLNQYSEASAQPGLSVSKILQLQVAKPEYDEQKMIAYQLIQIDKTLNAEQNFLHKLQKLQVGLMEDLLSGRKIVNMII